VAVATRNETGGMGLVGDRAVLPYLGGHFLVLDDNIYFLRGDNLGLEALGDPIKEDFFSDPDALWSVQIEADPIRDRILFTKPSVSGGFDGLYSFNYRTKSWSYEENAGNFLSRRGITRTLTYDGWLSGAPYTYDTGLAVFPSYDAMGTPDIPRMYLGYSDHLRYYGEKSSTQDPSPSLNVEVLIETGDFDFGTPDTDKVALRLSVKLKEAVGEDLSFNVFYSTDEGSSWTQTRGRALTIPAGDKENAVDFRARGSSLRFRLTSSSVVGEWTIREIVLRVSGSGREIHLPANR